MHLCSATVKLKCYFHYLVLWECEVKSIIYNLSVYPSYNLIRRYTPAL